MWKSAVGAQINISDPKNEEDDEWETDPDYVNDVNEEEQRWGGSGGRTAGAINMDQLRKETEEADTQKKKKELLEGTHNPSFGYGGKFGVEKDRMDSSAMGHEYIAKVEKHASQKDYSAGFGGKFGVQTDRVDQSALSWDHKEKLVKHASQKDYVSGFGGKFGVQSDRQDKSAVGWDHIEKVEKHESQKDYSKGFGGKFGVQSDRQDKSAVGWDHHEASQKHESQTDHKIGFGGKFGVQTDRVDKSAANFNEEPQKVGTNYTKVKPDIGGAKPSDLKARFETMGSQEAKKAPPTTGAPKKSIHAKAAMFSQKPSNEESATQPSEVASKPKQLDQSKLAQFNNATTANVQSQSKSNQIKDEIAQLKQKQEQKSPPATIIKEPKREPEIVLQKQEQEQIPEPEIVVQKQEQEQILEKVHLEKPHQEEPPRSEEIYQNVEVIQESAEAERQEQELLGDIEEPEYYSPDEIVDTGISATALYDYQAAAEDEISFDPDDEITHIEQIDEGWWRGLCKGKYGLFPANYVQVRE